MGTRKRKMTNVAERPDTFDATANERHAFETILLPRAIALGVLPPGTTRQALIDSMRQRWQAREGIGPESPKDKAAKLCAALAYMVTLGREATREPDDVNLVVAENCNPMLNALLGYLTALPDMQQFNSRNGASARTAVGDETRARVAKEAQSLRGLMSKAKASRKIADKIRREPAYVARILSRMYPGSKWSDETNES